jgi:hypothetical protein
MIQSNQPSQLAREIKLRESLDFTVLTTGHIYLTVTTVGFDGSSRGTKTLGPFLGLCRFTAEEGNEGLGGVHSGSEAYSKGALDYNYSDMATAPFPLFDI